MKKLFIFANLAVMMANVFGVDSQLSESSNRAGGAVQQPITHLINKPEEDRKKDVEKILKFGNFANVKTEGILRQDPLWSNELLISFLKSLSPRDIQENFSNLSNNFAQKDQIIDNFFNAEQYSEARIEGIPDLIKTLTKEQVEDVINTSAVCSEIIEGTNLVDSKTILNLLFHSKNKIPVSKEQNQKMCDNVYDDVSCFLEVLCAEHPLNFACERGNENIVKYLVEHGAEVNKEDDFGRTPLFYACQKGHENIVKYLIEHGSDINKEDKDRETPLFYACRSGNKDIVKYLVEKGADINKENYIRETPLNIARSRGYNNLVKYLIEHEANVNKEDDDEKTPLHIACESGNENIMEYLIRAYNKVRRWAIFSDFKNDDQ